MTFKLDSRYIGYPPVEPFLPTIAIATAAGTGFAAANQYPPVPPGIVLQAEDPVWGPGEFIFAKAGGTIRLRGLCTLLPVWNSTTRQFDWNATEAPNTALLGKMVGVCVSEQGSVGAVNALTTGQFGWFQISGLTPINGTATVAADTAFGIVAAGQVGTLAAGKQILSARVVTPATQTVVTAIAGAPGITAGFTFQLANVDGWFVGAYASGTGVGASAIVQAIDRLSNTVTVSVANTAAPSGNITATYNNATIFYNVCHLNRSFAQGAIT